MGGAMFRVYRQPYNRNIRIDEIETILKVTTLGAVIVDIGLSGKIDRARSNRDYITRYSPALPYLPELRRQSLQPRSRSDFGSQP